MNVQDIHWHDCRIVGVVERPTQIVAFQVEYPDNWEQGLFKDKTILFRDIFTYEIHEGPFTGPITILSASETPGVDDSRRLRLETNAGYRELRFRTLELAAGHVAS